MSILTTYQFNFINPITKRDDEVQFCAETLKEAKNLFFDFCKNDEKMPLIPKYSVSTVYNTEDAEFYGSEYCEEQNYEPMTKKRMKEILDIFVNRAFDGQDSEEAYRELLRIFTADELIYEFNSCESEVRDIQAEMEEEE